MSGVTRREFFAKSVLGFMDDLETTWGKAQVMVKKPPSPSHDATWSCLGRISEFPFGTSKMCEETSILVTVVSDGIYARDQLGSNKPLELRNGMLWVATKGEWSRDSVLSILTGERVNRNDPGEQHERR